MKTSTARTAATAESLAAAEPRSRARTSHGEQVVVATPYLAAQRRRIEGLTGAIAQRMGPEEELQMKAAGDVAQRAAPQEEELLQGRFAPVQRVEEEELLQGRFAVAQRRPAAPGAANRTGLPDGLKAGVESLSGLSMDNVRVHYNSGRPAQLNALAYAQGTDIHLAPGQEQHLPHEAWHVVQQAQGRVRPTMQMQGGTPVNDDASLESEADRMGARALQMRWQTALPHAAVAQAAGGFVAQMKWIPKITASARKHYDDGWGDAYGITNDDDLEDTVYDGSSELGVQEISLGTCQNPEEHISKYCNVLYENWTGKKGDDISTIFHCGPGTEG